jgi:hypothetical protein
MQTIESVINHMPTRVLLPIAQRVCPSSPAIKHWDNKAEPRYFRNPETLKEAVCATWQTGNFAEKKQIILMIEKAGW